MARQRSCRWMNSHSGHCEHQAHCSEWPEEKMRERKQCSERQLQGEHVFRCSLCCRCSSIGFHSEWTEQINHSLKLTGKVIRQRVFMLRPLRTTPWDVQGEKAVQCLVIAVAVNDWQRQWHAPKRSKRRGSCFAFTDSRRNSNCQ